MPSERVQRRIDGLLDQAEEAVAARDWNAVLESVRSVFSVDATNEDAAAFQAIAETALDSGDAQGESDSTTSTIATASPPSGTVKAPRPTSFSSGRYVVKGSLGEGGKKMVYLATDTTLDRDVAFALIKTEGLDDVGRERGPLSPVDRNRRQGQRRARGGRGRHDGGGTVRLTGTTQTPHRCETR